LLATEIASEYGFTGGLSASFTACSAGGNAIVKAVDDIRLGNSKVVCVGGVDPITELTYMGFNCMMVITKTGLKPLDKDRSGLLIGEGSGSLILEDEEHAIKRGAKIYGEVAGYGLSNDAYHATQPHPEAHGAVIAMKEALRDSKTSTDEIQYINVHGTGTKHNDIVELKAIQKVFGNRGKSIPISSSKSMIGHTLGAAGVIEAIISTVSLCKSILPPSLNFDNKIENFDYTVVDKPKKVNGLNTIMSNSFGFGGNGASLILKNYN